MRRPPDPTPISPGQRERASEEASAPAEIISLHIPMSLWPAGATPDLEAPAGPLGGPATYDESLECQVGEALAVLRCMDERLWGATPVRTGLRIDCWVSRRDFAEGITAVEDLGRQHGLRWALPECGEVAGPTRLGDTQTLQTHLDLLWQAGAGWLILEAGANLEWYVQVLLDDEDPVAEVEAVAGRFAVTRLLADQRRALLRHGFAAPHDAEARNATRTQRLDCAASRAALADTMRGVMHEVYGCGDDDPVVMRLRR